jgi:hypothetical protein
MPDQSNDDREKNIERVNVALQVLSGTELRKLVEDLESGVARYNRANLVIEAARASRSGAMSQLPQRDDG